MIKFSFKTFVRYCLMFLAFSLMSMLVSSCEVKAAAVEDFLFLDRKVDSEFTMAANGSVTGGLVVTTTWLNNTDAGSYLYVDLCTNGYEPTLWVNSTAAGSVAPSTKWYKVDQKCSISGVGLGTVYRQIMYVTSVNKFDDSRGTQLLANLQLFSNTSYTTKFRIFHMGVTDDVPLGDLAYDNDLTQTQVLQDILSALKSQSNSDITGAINSQTQKIQDQINKQQQTNDKLDSVNGNLNDLENQQKETNDKLDDVNKNQEETNKKLDETNKNITSTDTSGANDKANSFFEDFEDSDYGLSDIITMPLTFIQRITNGTCTPLKIPIPFVDYDMTLPCMSEIYSTYFGDILQIYQTITFGIIAYAICINIFATVRGFKNPDEDKVEVIDL